MNITFMKKLSGGFLDRGYQIDFTREIDNNLDDSVFFIIEQGLVDKLTKNNIIPELKDFTRHNYRSSIKEELRNRLELIADILLKTFKSSLLKKELETHSRSLFSNRIGLVLKDFDLQSYRLAFSDLCFNGTPKSQNKLSFWPVSIVGASQFYIQDKINYNLEKVYYEYNPGDVSINPKFLYQMIMDFLKSFHKELLNQFPKPIEYILSPFSYINNRNNITGNSVRTMFKTDLNNFDNNIKELNNKLETEINKLKGAENLEEYYFYVKVNMGLF